MHFIQGEIYHVYNRGNNKQKIFFSEENYRFFIRKVRDQLKPVSDILCWCLMPNHFHFVIHANELSCKERIGFGMKSMQELPFRIGKLLSSYSRAINNQNGTSGSLFQQKTKSKILTNKKLNLDNHYLLNVIHYCHQNPWRARLVNKIEEWPFSSFPDYCGLRDDDLCNRQLFLELTGHSLDDFYKDSYGRIEGIDLEE